MVQVKFVFGSSFNFRPISMKHSSVSSLQLSRRSFLRHSAQGAALVALGGCAAVAQGADDTVTNPPPAPSRLSLVQVESGPKPPLEAIMAPELPQTPLDAKIGQMLMLGFRGSWVDEGDLIIDAIIQRNLGSVVLFDVDVAGGWGQRNIVSPEQLRSLTRKLQSVAPIPLLISMDQEGGKVTRLAERYGFPATQSHAALGALNDVTATRAASQAMATTLAAMGVNLNLAPVVDVAVNPRNPIIARVERSFSADPAVVAAQAEAFIDGHHAAGVRCTLKHFPGHGSSVRDTHLGFVDVTDTWSDGELAPYRRLIAAGKVDAVMTAHIYNRMWDDEYPATLSPAVIDGLLRQQLGFDGVVISDDLQMRAITDLYSLEKAIELAILAGIDICAVANNTTYSGDVAERFFATVYRMLDAGIISEARIERSYRRILQLKGLQEYQLP